MTLPRLRRVSAASTLLVLALSLSACGDDGDGDGDDETTDQDPTSSQTTDAPDEPTEPSETETESEPPAPEPGALPAEDVLRAALLTSADVPEGFVEEPDDSEDSDDAFEGTCLGDVGNFDDAFGGEPDVEVETQFVSEGTAAQAFVGSGLNAYTDTAKVQAAFGEFITRLQDCTQVESTDEDGVTIALDIAYDPSVTLPDADQQLRIDMTGTIGVETDSYPIAYSFVVSLSDNVVSLIGAYELGETDTGLRDGIDGWAELQAERLADAVG